MRISLDNGMTFMDASDAIREIRERNLWDVLVNSMDDEIRESVHTEHAPCSDDEFLTAYLAAAHEDLIIG